jgi:hypothetical protein
MKEERMQEKSKVVSRRWRTAAVLAAGVAVGAVLFATPAAGHFQASITHIWSHIKPKADARYDRPTVKKLETVRGTIGGQVISSTAGEWGFNAQLPRFARAGLDDAHVTIDGVDEASGECSGTASNPTASAGYVCIYPYSVSGMTANQGALWGAGDGTKWGFQASVDADSADSEVWWFANWAYRGTNAAVSPRLASRAASDGCSTPGVGGC